MTIFNSDEWYETKIAEAEKRKLEAEAKLIKAKQKLIDAKKEFEKQMELIKIEKNDFFLNIYKKS